MTNLGRRRNGGPVVEIRGLVIGAEGHVVDDLEGCGTHDIMCLEMMNVMSVLIPNPAFDSVHKTVFILLASHF